MASHPAGPSPAAAKCFCFVKCTTAPMQCISGCVVMFPFGNVCKYLHENNPPTNTHINAHTCTHMHTHVRTYAHTYTCSFPPHKLSIWVNSILATVPRSKPTLCGTVRKFEAEHHHVPLRVFCATKYLCWQVTVERISCVRVARA